MDKTKRGRITQGETTKVRTGCGNMYVTTGKQDDVLVEVFGSLGKAGGCTKCQGEALTRSISLGLKYGVPMEEYIEELKELRCPSPAFDSGKPIHSCPDAIARVLGGEFNEGSSDKPDSIPPKE